jgi:cytochrome P450
VSDKTGDTIADLPPLGMDLHTYAMNNPVDPRPAYERVLRECPMARTGDGVARSSEGVAIFRMEDLRHVNRHPDILGQGAVMAPRGSLGAARPQIPLDLEGDLHRKFRHVLDPIFAPRKMRELEPAVVHRINAIIDGFYDRGKAELFDELCTPLPASVFLDMLGIPQSSMPALIEFKDAVLRPQGASYEEAIAYMEAAGQQGYAFFNEFLDERAASGESPNDWTTYLCNATIEGTPITRDQVVDIMYNLVIAALDTVAASLSLILAWLVQHPAERRWLVEDPARWPAAIEELMRYESPVAYGARTATADVVVGGTLCPAGTRFDISWPGTNMDPAVFVDPEKVILDRNPNPHSVFATGRHRCLGSHLARMELRVALEELHRRIPEYGLDPDRELVYEAVGVRVASVLPVVWNPA